MEKNGAQEPKKVVAQKPVKSLGQRTLEALELKSEDVLKAIYCDQHGKDSLDDEGNVVVTNGMKVVTQDGRKGVYFPGAVDASKRPYFCLVCKTGLLSGDKSEDPPGLDARWPRGDLAFENLCMKHRDADWSEALNAASNALGQLDTVHQKKNREAIEAGLAPLNLPRMIWPPMNTPKD